MRCTPCEPPLPDTRLTHADVADAGRDLALGQMAVPHQPPVALFGQFIGMRFENTRDLGFDGLGQ
jgi:hypothetical protein